MKCWFLPHNCFEVIIRSVLLFNTFKQIPSQRPQIFPNSSPFFLSPHREPSKPPQLPQFFSRTSESLPNPTWGPWGPPCEPLGKRIKYLQSDNGTEYLTKDFEDFLDQHGIGLRLTVPHSPEQNGIAERKKSNFSWDSEMSPITLESAAAFLGWGCSYS